MAQLSLEHLERPWKSQSNHRNTRIHIFFFCFQSHYAQQARRSRSVAKKRKRETSAPPTSRTRSQSASRPPRDQSGIRDPKVQDRCLNFDFIHWNVLLLNNSVHPLDLWRQGFLEKSDMNSSLLGFFFFFMHSWVMFFVYSSDGKEGEEDDEELPERHEPPRQEGRGGQTRVWPQTQTSSGREEEVRHQRSQIKLLFLDCWDPNTLLGKIMSSFYTFPQQYKDEHWISLLRKLWSFNVSVTWEHHPWGWWCHRKL